MSLRRRIGAATRGRALGLPDRRCLHCNESIEGRPARARYCAKPKRCGDTNWRRAHPAHSLVAIQSLPDKTPADNRTLGWAVLQWTAEYLQQPDGPDAGQLWAYTDEQARVVLRWYEIDARGRLIHRRGVLRRMKGWGKDPFLASLAAVELCGPCRFGGWASDGSPIAIQHPAPWIQVAAVTLEQTRNTMLLFPGMFSKDAIKEFSIDVGKEKIYARGVGQIQAVTSSPTALEGNRATFVIANEALALDTPLPTPGGWTTMGDVQPGDQLLGRNGRATVVLKATPVQYDRACFRVCFEDGTSVVASDGHLWATRLAGSGAKPRVRSAAEMVADGRKFRIPAPSAWDRPPSTFLVDPYALGLWLGDGNRGQPYLTASDDDAPEIVAQLAARDVAARSVPQRRRACRIALSGRAGFHKGTEFGEALRALPCFYDKHVPTCYFEGSIEQRSELLRGLMDSDGCVTKDGGCIFVGTNQLASDVLYLLRTLGQVASHSFAPDSRSRTGGSHRVSFTPRGGLVPFSLPRKVARVNQHRRGPDWVTVSAIEAVESVPVRCVAVDASDHLFLVGEGGHVTHNSHLWLTNNDGIEMSKVIKRNLAKARDGEARAMEITNAHLPGEGSAAEETFEAWRTGKLKDIYYDSREATAVKDITDRSAIREALLIVRGDSTWLDVERLLDEIADPTTPEWESRRYYLNEVVAAGAERWISAERWKASESDRLIEDHAEVVLGFDGSFNFDATALVVVALGETAHLDVVKSWEPTPMSPPDWQVPIEDVEDEIREACKRWQVREIVADSYRWARSLEILEKEGLPVLDFPQRPARMIPATTRFGEAITNGGLTHSANPDLARHVENAVLKVTSAGSQLSKDAKYSPRRIDLAVASVMAFERAAAYRPSSPEVYDLNAIYQEMLDNGEDVSSPYE